MKISPFFAAYKKAADGMTWDYHKGLTHEQARNTDRFPLGVQYEKDGTPYIWTYGANNGRQF